jgi:DNA-binding beta-propeller fold protein YncE
MSPPHTFHEDPLGIRIVLLGISLAIFTTMAHAHAYPEPKVQVPQYKVSASWPKPLPHNWILGQVSGVAADENDHIWIIQRPGSLTDTQRKGSVTSKGANSGGVPAPPVIEFDQEGNVVNSWGGPGAHFDWPKREHGIYVDQEGFVWIGGNGPNDNMLLKFDKQGHFLMQIGSAAPSRGSHDKTQLGGPASVYVDTIANEVFVADGYLNKRVIVFDSKTGAYKRHWGAYGGVPSDAVLPVNDPSSPQFANPVHSLRIMKDGTIFVCDRTNNRIQIFEKNGKYLRQIELNTDTKGQGSVWDLVPADPDQTFLLIADGSNNQVEVVVRETGQKVGSFGRTGHDPGEFERVHSLAIDSKGNLYTGEVDTGMRIQRFTRAK